MRLLLGTVLIFIFSYCWTPLDYVDEEGENGQCMVYKYLAEWQKHTWDACQKPVIFKPSIIHRYIEVR